MKTKMLAVVVLFVALFISVPVIGGSAQYEYDKLHRLTKVTYDDGTTITYTYDALGNRLTNEVSKVPQQEVVADFTASPTSGRAPLTVNFTDQSQGNITSWLWDFGDGGTSTEQNPSYTYVTEGINNETYTVSLTVSGPNGGDTETKVDYLTVGKPYVACKMTPDATVIQRGGLIGFQAFVKNNTSSSGTVSFATKLTRPDGTSTGWIDGPYQLTITAYETKSGRISHTIPTDFQLGTYYYHGYVGSAGTIYHQCGFEFEVTE